MCVSPFRRLCAHSHDQLAEVATFQHTLSERHRFLQTIDEVLAIADAAIGDAGSDLAQEFGVVRSFHDSKPARLIYFYCFVCVSHVNLLAVNKLFMTVMRCRFWNIQTALVDFGLPAHRRYSERPPRYE